MARKPAPTVIISQHGVAIVFKIDCETERVLRKTDDPFLWLCRKTMSSSNREGGRSKEQFGCFWEKKQNQTVAQGSMYVMFRLNVM